MYLFVKYRWLFSTILFVLAVSGIPFLLKAIVPNNALSVWFLEDDPALVAYHRFHEQFGNDEVIVLAIENKKGIFTTAQLQQIRHLTSQLQSVEGISEVVSISNIQDIRIRKGVIQYETLVPDPVPSDTAALHSIAQKALLSPLTADKLVNTRGTSSILILRMSVMDDIDARRNTVVQHVRNTAAQVLGEKNVHMGGSGVIYAGLNQLTQHDFGLFASLSYVCMFLIMWWLYRSWQVVVLALLTILTANMLTLSLYGAMGYGINMITMMLPTLIIVLGIMDIMHIMNEFEQVSGSRHFIQDKKQLVVQVLQKVWKPCLFTTLTTIAGFLALTASPMAVLKELGIFAAAGLAIALLCSFVFSGLILSYLPHFRREKEPESYRLTGLLDQQLMHVYHHAKAYWLGLVCLVILLGYGASKVVTDTYTIGYLPQDHPVVQDHHFIEHTWGPYFPLEFTVQPLQNRTIKDPEVIRAMKSFVEEASLLPEVRTGYSLHLLYERSFPLVYGPIWEKKLQSKPAIEYITRQALRKSPESLRPWVNKDFSLARMTLVGKLVSAEELQQSLIKLKKLSDKHFNGIATVRATGYPPLFAQIVSYIMQSQKQSFLLAIALVFFCMLGMLKNLKMALLSVMPSLLLVVLLLGVMGYMGITLDVATATVVAIVIGFSIDDTIHYIYHYQQEKQTSRTYFEAQQNTIRHIGKAIVLTSLTLFLGYLVLLLASVKTVFYFGLLTAIAIAGALLTQLLFFPLLLKTFDKKPSRSLLLNAESAL